MAGDITNLSLNALTFDDLKFNITEDNFRNLQLSYRGEGNDNLVLRAPNIKYILRFRKHETTIDEVQEDKKLRTSFVYHFAIIEPLFGVYCVLPVVAEAPKSEVERFDSALFSDRPSHRQEKRVLYSGVEIHPDYAFLPLYAEYLNLKKHLILRKAPSSNRLRHLLSNAYLNYRDFVFSLLVDINLSKEIVGIARYRANVWSVEIKPKQAWSAIVDRRAMCHYCMHQFFKLSTNKIKSRSKYCPLDLFSGNRMRMRDSLLALLQTPQNNLKIFRNGELVYAEDCSTNIHDVLQDWFVSNSERSLDLFCHVITEALLSEFAVDSKTIHLSCKPHSVVRKPVLCPALNMQILEQNLVKRSKCSWSVHPPENSILGRILLVQQLDKSGIETVYDYYESHRSEFESEFAYVDRLVADSRMVNGRLEMPELNVVEAYLLSTAAKDLSILIALEPTTQTDQETKSYTIADLRNQLYKVHVSVVDVGPKSVSCVKKHWKRNANILTACARHLCPESEIGE